MDSNTTQEEVTIIDKDESAERVVSVVGGFLIEESITPFPVRFNPLKLHLFISHDPPAKTFLSAVHT